MKNLVHKDWKPKDWNEVVWVIQQIILKNKIDWKKLILKEPKKIVK